MTSLSPQLQIIFIIKGKRLLLYAQGCRELNKRPKLTLKNSWTAFLKLTNQPIQDLEKDGHLSRETHSGLPGDKQQSVTSKRSTPPGVANGWRPSGHWQDSTVPEAAKTAGSPHLLSLQESHGAPIETNLLIKSLGGATLGRGDEAVPTMEGQEIPHVKAFLSFLQRDFSFLFFLIDKGIFPFFF